MAEKPRQTYHQDYIARIRYSNALPPPPCPPKLLDIPNTGLSSGQYTSAGFASRLAREQPLNIEADAELGMPIDMVGIPGIFQGNESAIFALDSHKRPTLHAEDLKLLRAPTALGKDTSGASGISFLRRTEYTTSYTTGGTKFESSNSSNTVRVRDKRRRPADVSRDDPINISRHILKGFNLAYPTDAYKGADSTENLRAASISLEEQKAWDNPTHPTNKSLTLLDSYPVVPDWDALPDTGAYSLYKFSGPPVKDSDDDHYDERLDVALFRPVGQTVEDSEIYLRDAALHKEDPLHNPVALPRYQFEYFLPSNKENIRGIKRNFTTNDPENEDEIPFEHGEDDDGRSRKLFKFDFVRAYETFSVSGNPANPYSDYVAVALHDPESHPDEPLRSTKLQKAAYFYPISQRTTIKGKRFGNIEMVGEPPQKVDIIEAIGRDPYSEKEAEKRDEVRMRYDEIEA